MLEAGGNLSTSSVTEVEAELFCRTRLKGGGGDLGLHYGSSIGDAILKGGSMNAVADIVQGMVTE
jgi:hypothetical protein